MPGTTAGSSNSDWIKHLKECASEPCETGQEARQIATETADKKGQSKAFPDAVIERYGTQNTGIQHASFFEHVPEKVPELVVPDLSECELRPYVSYATEDVYQDELTSQDLFNVIYGRKIIEDFKTNKLDADGHSVEPSALEQLRPDTAARLARQTGSDIFLGGEPYSKTFAIKYPIGKR